MKVLCSSSSAAFACAALLLTHTASAAIQFTFTGIVDNISSGSTTSAYTLNDTVSVTFTSSLSTPPNVWNDNDAALWERNMPADPALYSSVSVTNALGVYNDADRGENPNSEILIAQDGSPNDIHFVGARDLPTVGIGLFYGPVEIEYINLNVVGILSPWNPVFPADATTNIDDIVAPGVYNISGTLIIDEFDFIGETFISGRTYGIDLQTMTVSQVPEPGAYAALAGLAMLGFVTWRRKSRAHRGAKAC